ncbi:hypothetical protein VN97_g2255 [Penicillium thymicola]|uniref:Uncharacterized protein n=1 Tax=Penicillium thymicola TaxID=293382 RepID=A0AAI9TQT3_PENTH|nr:hypothetical protein VN97_g2255 [Penicillium thymicola]
MPISSTVTFLYTRGIHVELSQPGDIIESDGTVNLSTLRTRPGGDFNWNFNAYHWTPEKETAEEYRLFAARRCPAADTCIVHIQVPQSFVNSLRCEDLWYSPSWKEYIWTSRREQMPDPKFDYLWKLGQADIVRGPICSAISTKIARIRRENVQSRISEDHVMRLPSGKKHLGGSSSKMMRSISWQSRSEGRCTSSLLKPHRVSPIDQIPPLLLSLLTTREYVS